MVQSISWEQFEERFKPIQNHVSNREEFNGWLFETFGEDNKFVYDQALNYGGEGYTAANIWTIVSSDEYEVIIISGCHYVNREGYIITEIACPKDESYEVVDEDDKWKEEENEEDFIAQNQNV